MPQIFRPPMNTVARVSIFGALIIVFLFFATLWTYVRTPHATEAGTVRIQPVPFSHQHHVGDAGIDCRYCHTSVEDSSFAGIPPTATCMNCHSELWNDSPILLPVRESMRTGEPLRWTRVHDVPDFAYFDHSIHINKGVGCVTCHGEVDEMPLMWREHSLLMEWCLECHRDPGAYLRPPDEVFNLHWTPPANREALIEELMEKNQVKSKTDCYTCHR